MINENYIFEKTEKNSLKNLNSEQIHKALDYIWTNNEKIYNGIKKISLTKTLYAKDWNLNSNSIKTDYILSLPDLNVKEETYKLSLDDDIIISSSEEINVEENEFYSVLYNNSGVYCEGFSLDSMNQPTGLIFKYKNSSPNYDLKINILILKSIGIEDLLKYEDPKENDQTQEG